MAPTSKTHECITDFAAEAWVAGGEPPSMLFPLGDGPRNTGSFSSPPVKTKLNKLCQNIAQSEDKRQDK